MGYTFKGIPDNKRLYYGLDLGWDDPEVKAAHQWVLSGGELCRISGNPCRYAFTCPANDGIDLTKNEIKYTSLYSEDNDLLTGRRKRPIVNKCCHILKNFRQCC